MPEFNPDSSSLDQPTPRPGPYLAKVVSNIDPTYMGILEVEILRPGGNNSNEGQLHQVKYMTPFYGVTDVKHTTGSPNDYNNSQKSYGMWMVPPDTGTTVMVIFVDGDPKRGYWIGCVPDDKMNFMMPGLAATQKVTQDVEPDSQGLYGRVPTAEYNKSDKEAQTSTNPNRNLKPRHPFTDALHAQGLLFDDARGITSSSSRREAPSMVFGISTPGPVDKQDGAKRGNIGKAEWAVPNAYVSRLGGTTFVMDDGDAAFLRRKAPTDGPPDYAGVENGEDDGDVTRPHNELFRIRTRTGHQILMHNSEDLIYITNSRGTSWIELSSDGKIDIYAQDSISVHTGNDLNFYADRDINMEAGRNFNLKVAERHQTEVGMDKICIVNGNVSIQVDGTQNETITGAHTQSFEATWDVTAGDQTNISIGSGLDIAVSSGTKLSSGADFDVNTGGGNKLTSGGNAEIAAANTTISGGNINLNGPAAASAKSAGAATVATLPEPLPTIDNPTETDGVKITSIMARVPTTEPYPHHENLDATLFKPHATDREVATAIQVPPAWKAYSTGQDTFIPPPPPAK